MMKSCDAQIIVRSKEIRTKDNDNVWMGRLLRFFCILNSTEKTERYWPLSQIFDSPAHEEFERDKNIFQKINHPLFEYMKLEVPAQGATLSVKYQKAKSAGPFKLSHFFDSIRVQVFETHVDNSYSFHDRISAKRLDVMYATGDLKVTFTSENSFEMEIPSELFTSGFLNTSRNACVDVQFAETKDANQYWVQHVELLVRLDYAHRVLVCDLLKTAHPLDRTREVLLLTGNPIEKYIPHLLWPPFFESSLPKPYHVEEHMLFQKMAVFRKNVLIVNHNQNSGKPNYFDFQSFLLFGNRINFTAWTVSPPFPSFSSFSQDNTQSNNNNVNNKQIKDLYILLTSRTVKLNITSVTLQKDSHITDINRCVSFGNACKVNIDDITVGFNLEHLLVEYQTFTDSTDINHCVDVYMFWSERYAPNTIKKDVEVATPQKDESEDQNGIPLWAQTQI